MAYINVTPISVGIDQLQNIDIIQYELNSDPRIHFGFVAQDVADHILDAAVVPSNPGEKFGTQYQELIAPSIKGTQQTKLLADNNTTRIFDLENRINNNISDPIFEIQKFIGWYWTLSFSPFGNLESLITIYAMTSVHNCYALAINGQILNPPGFSFLFPPWVETWIDDGDIVIGIDPIIPGTPSHPLCPP